MPGFSLDLERFLYQFGPDRRRTQDSPVLPSVWKEYLESGGEPVRLLLTPHRETRPAQLAARIRRALAERAEGRQSPMNIDSANSVSVCKVAHNQSTVAVDATFEQMVTGVVPFSQWWKDHIFPHLAEVKKYSRYPKPTKKLRQLLDDLVEPGKVTCELPLTVVWWLRLVGHMAMHMEDSGAKEDRETLMKKAAALLPDPSKKIGDEGGLFRVSVNRRPEPACLDSVRTVKADAARRVFEIDTGRICWAVLDSGIDARHPAFNNKKGKSRVVETYDFTKVRRLLALASTPGDSAENELQDEFGVSADKARQIRTALATGGDVDWETLKSPLQVSRTPRSRTRYAESLSSHGTHVAGILAGRPAHVEGQGEFHGMCPEMRVLDIRILDESERSGEFDIIAALQFIRYLNSASDEPVVHGVNLSIQLQHNPRDFACGRTPICEECGRLVASGVVVVAAAGNLGIERGPAAAPTTEGSFREASIMDPGNADSVITVGSTHRKRPHAYGVSYFSSRGPTGDGRQKPDLVAPGEKILGPILNGNQQYGEMEGTSMAAPHVSGAAALLLARHSELIGDPRRVKKILCDTATDLRRQREYQGAGVVDILRALQSI